MEVLDVLLSDGPYPEDFEVDEEDKTVFKELSSILKSQKSLFNKFVTIFGGLLETFSLTPSNSIDKSASVNLFSYHMHSVLSALKTLQELIITEELSVGFTDAVVPFLNNFLHKNVFYSFSPILPNSLQCEKVSIEKVKLYFLLTVLFKFVFYNV